MIKVLMLVAVLAVPSIMFSGSDDAQFDLAAKPPRGDHNPGGLPVVPRRQFYQIRVHAADETYLERVTLFIDSMQVQTFIGNPLANGEYTYDWKVPGKKNRVYEIKVQAWDKAGNTSTDSLKVIGQ